MSKLPLSQGSELHAPAEASFPQTEDGSMPGKHSYTTKSKPPSNRQGAQENSTVN